MIRLFCMRMLVGLVAMTACAEMPTVEFVGGQQSEAPVFLLHGTGENGSDIASRWSMHDAIAPDDLSEVVDMIGVGERAILLGQGSGASFAYELACTRPDLVSAVVMLSGVASDTACVSGPAVSVLTAHGTVDDIVPYSTARPTFDRARAIARCTDIAYVDAPELPATVESLGCLERTDGQTRAAEHWRVIGWDHNPVLGESWSLAVSEWIADKS